MRFVSGVDGDALSAVWPRFLLNDRLSTGLDEPCVWLEHRTG